MPLVSKTVEVNADADSILRIVADFEAYPEWNDEVKAVYVLARYDDGRPSQLRLDMEIQGQSGTFIQAVYYPGAGQIQTVLQQGDVFTKQDQLFSVVAMGPSSLLTVDLEVETSLPVPDIMVKKLVNDVLEHLANNLKTRAEQLRRELASRRSCSCRAKVRVTSTTTTGARERGSRARSCLRRTASATSRCARAVPAAGAHRR